ncbi:MAG: hypothetical protein IKJ43_00230 [Bacilli bacterium]|nr:hypothetical protein [Bacilli bacterium]
MSELMKEYIGQDKEKKELIEKLIEELKINGMSEENIRIVVDNFIKNHGDEQTFVRPDFAEEVNERKKR